jgi:hypothetical protein
MQLGSRPKASTLCKSGCFLLCIELFSDGARAVASLPRPKPSKPTVAELQAKLDAARAWLRVFVVFGM